MSLTWTPSGTAVSGSDTAGQIAAAYEPPSGSFSWESGYPSELHSFWSEGSSNMILADALTRLEARIALLMESGRIVFEGDWAAFEAENPSLFGNMYQFYRDFLEDFCDYAGKLHLAELDASHVASWLDRQPVAHLPLAI